MKACALANRIGIGPWVLSIIAVVLIGLSSSAVDVEQANLRQFTTSLAWLMAGSLMLTGGLHLAFIGFVADGSTAAGDRLINANLIGVLMLNTLVSGLIACAVAVILFHEAFGYEVLMIANFVLMTNVWMIVLHAARIKQFTFVLSVIAAGYLFGLVCAVMLMPFGLNGLLAGLLLGHAGIFFMMLAIVFAQNAVRATPRFDFLTHNVFMPSLLTIGILYNSGVWVDKLFFWLAPVSSELIVGPLRYSSVYDAPMFLAGLSIIPGIAVCLMRLETDFVRSHDDYRQCLHANVDAAEIDMLRKHMIDSVHNGLLQIARVQAATIVLLIVLAPTLIRWAGTPEQFVHLYYTNLVGVGAQVLMIAVLNVLLHLDKLGDALKITALVFASNALFTTASLQLGPACYGYGFGLSMTLSAIVSIVLLYRRLAIVESEAVMTSHRYMNSLG